MFLNSLLSYSQNLFHKLYEKSFVLKKIDTLIYFNILTVLFLSLFAPSDSIGIFAIFAIILTLIKLLTKKGARVTFSISDKILLIYFFLVLISLAGSSLFILSFKGFCKTLIYLGFYVSFVNYINDNRAKIKQILILLSIFILGESVIALKQNFISVAEISGWQDMSRLNPEQVMTRVYGSLKPYNPNLFGGYLLATLPATLILIFLPIINKQYKMALIGLGVSLLCLSSVVMTGCRGAYIGLFFELLMIFLLLYKLLKPRFKKLLLALTTFFSSLLFLIVLMTNSLRARVLSIFVMRNDSSNSFRFNVYNSCIDMLKDNWLLGIGIGNQNFREIYGLYMKTGFDALSAYNIYLETAIESGVFALIAFLAFLFVNLFLAFKYIKTRNNINVIYLSIAVISIIGMMVHGLVDTVFFRPQVQFVFWIMVGIIRAITTPRGWVNVRNREA